MLCCVDVELPLLLDGVEGLIVGCDNAVIFCIFCLAELKSISDIGAFRLSFW